MAWFNLRNDEKNARELVRQAIKLQQEALDAGKLELVTMVAAAAQDIIAILGEVKKITGPWEKRIQDAEKIVKQARRELAKNEPKARKERPQFSVQGQMVSPNLAAYESALLKALVASVSGPREETIINNPTALIEKAFPKNKGPRFGRGKGTTGVVSASQYVAEGQYYDHVRLIVGKYRLWCEGTTADIVYKITASIFRQVLHAIGDPNELRKAFARVNGSFPDNPNGGPVPYNSVGCSGAVFG